MCKTAIAVTARKTLGFTGLAPSWACHQLSTHTTRICRTMLRHSLPNGNAPLVFSRHPGWLGETCVHQLAAVCLHESYGALTKWDGTLWQRHESHTKPYIMSLLGKIS